MTQPLVGLQFVSISPVERPIKRNRRLNGGVLVFETGLKSWIVGRQRHEPGEMPAGRTTRYRDKCRVAAIVLNVAFGPRERCLAVDDVIRKSGFRTEPITD